MKTSRRRFIRDCSVAMAGLAVSGMAGAKPGRTAGFPHLRSSKFANKVVVLGMDGMDPGLVRRFIAEGRMPTFRRLMEKGHFGELRTTMPAQSPVAWASFITGTNPGGHGIYDFIHRDASSFTPHLSTSRSFDAPYSIKLGDYALPLGSGRVDLLRKGRPFWSFLEEKGIPSSIYQLPANFPVVESDTRAISGMGTPDLLGGYGTFTLFSESFVSGSDKFNGGRVVRLKPLHHKAVGALEGPKNPFRRNAEDARVDITFLRDPVSPLVTIKVQDQTLVLKQGEWSGWVPVRFEYMPHLLSAAGMVRFYVKEVHPRLKVYCSPINIDPIEPILPISSPESFSREVAENIGRFYTQGFPADTKALSHQVLSDDEYFEQAKLVLDESMHALDFWLKNFFEGFFFFYFSSIDQNSHMLLRAMDPTHPLYDPKASDEVKNAIRYFYDRMDEALRMTLEKVDSQTHLFAISDHGFSTFHREFHLSTWLVENGFMTLTDKSKIEDMRFFDYVDWEKTKAYALGLNGLYINRRGREKGGVVSDEEAQRVKREIQAGLATVRDPKTGELIVTQAYDSEQIYRGPYTALAPDLIIGYRKGYRVSDEAVFGRFGRAIVGDRTDKWSADHCGDSALVPGMLLMNRELKKQNPGLCDMAPTILQSFGIPVPPEMEGTAI